MTTIRKSPNLSYLCEHHRWPAESGITFGKYYFSNSKQEFSPIGLLPWDKTDLAMRYEMQGKKWFVVPPVSAPGHARPEVIEECSIYGLPTSFTDVVLAIGEKESKLTYNLPATTFCSAEVEDRKGKSLITAYGVFQVNMVSLRSEIYGNQIQFQGLNGPLPYDSNHLVYQISQPIFTYAKQAYRLVEKGTLTKKNLLALLMLYQALPSMCNSFVDSTSIGADPLIWLEAKYKFSPSRLLNAVINHYKENVNDIN